MTDEVETPEDDEPLVKRGRLHPALWTIIACVAAVLLVAAVALVTRYGVTTSPGRLFVEARLEGLKIGRFGRLRVEGLDGDIWRDFTVRRLTISDEKGVWVEAHNLNVVWNYPSLFARRFQADLVRAEQLTVLRRPTLTPKGVDRGLPVSFDIDRLQARVEMAPEFSYRRGLFDLSGSLDIQRRGGRQVDIEARSLLHQGDYLSVDFDQSNDQRLRLVADAKESSGGALAGALGLPVDRPFELVARADGSMDEGQFNLIARSGNHTPVRALGGWNEDGGQAAGRIDLAASTLTQGLVRRFGPSALVSVAGRRFRGGNYAVDGRIVAENLTVNFKGPADLKARKLTPEGLAVVADTGSFKQLIGGPADGGARVAGMLRGDLTDFTLSGKITGRDVTYGDYRLAEASGPVRLSRARGEWRLAGALDGARGQGRGLIAALLGARPKATIDASRLADGRMLVRRVTANGPGLQLDARGERGVLGGLSFEGDARVANLTAIRPDASGQVQASWTAARARGADRPWTLSFDARGQRLATGLAELDRLLGGTPRLRARGAYQDGRIDIAESRLDGAAGSVRAAGLLAGEGGMRLRLDWNATGPFSAGPVEIAGAMTGSGSLTGTLAQPVANLTAEVEAIDLPRLPLTNAKVNLQFARRPNGTSGLFAIEADSEYGPARATTDFAFTEGGVRLTNLDADAGGIEAAGAVSLVRGQPSTADLAVNIGAGALLTRGQIAGTVRIADAPGGPRAVLDLTAENAAIRGAGQVALSRAAIQANGPLARLPLAIEAQGASGPGPWRINGTGVLATLDEGYSLSLNASGRIARSPFETLEPAVFRFGGPTRSARLRLEVGRGRANLDASLTGDAATLTAVLDNVALGAFNEDLAGRIDARATLQGEGKRLTGALEARLDGARGRGAPQNLSLDGTVRARLTGDSLAIEAAASNAEGLRSNANVVLPVEASAAPFRLAVATRRPVNGRFFAEGEIKPLWDLFVGGERTLAGQVTANGTLSGTLADPEANGQLSLASGRFEDGLTGLELQGLTLSAALRGDNVDVSNVSAGDGNGGRVTGGGRISLQRNGVSTFRMTLDEFQVIDNELATAEASGQATINRGADGRVNLEGALTIDRATVAANPPTPSGVVNMDVIEINKPEAVAEALQTEASGGLAIGLDVTLDAPRRVFVQGRGLDVELAVDAHVGGTTRDPVLTGTARVVRGEYVFAGKRFDFDPRGTVVLATDPERIRLDLTATREDPSLTAVIRVRGTAARPEITLTSSPALPSDEVLSQVLFGASASQLSPIEAAQLASALAALAGGGGFDVIGGLRGLTGLDRLAFAGGGDAGLTVAGGKYLTDDVYLEIIGGGREGPAVQVEWRVRRSLAIVSRVAGQGDARLSVRWRRDY